MPQTIAAAQGCSHWEFGVHVAEPVVWANARALMAMIETVAINCFMVSAPFLVSMEDGAVCPNDNRGNSN